MIPKIYKFPLRTDFLKFRKISQKFVTPSLIIYHAPSKTKHTRLSVIITKKVSKLATTRNYLKRLTLDALWLIVKDQTLDCVVVYKPLPLKKNKDTALNLKSELSLLNLKS